MATVQVMVRLDGRLVVMVMSHITMVLIVMIRDGTEVTLSVFGRIHVVNPLLTLIIVIVVDLASIANLARIIKHSA